jgi:hypothetical protein
MRRRAFFGEAKPDASGPKGCAFSSLSAVCRRVGGLLHLQAVLAAYSAKQPFNKGAVNVRDAVKKAVHVHRFEV